jgi:prevent-host-death family protein
MKTLTAKDAKYGFGRLIDLARAEPVLIAKHGRPVVVVMAVETFERLKALDALANARSVWSMSRHGQ